MNKRGLLIVLSGPSGVGKGTVRAELMKDRSLNLFYSISMTTRKQRPGEVNGKDYYFVTPEEFQENIDKGNLLEWAEFVGNRYGTPKDKVEKMLDEGKNVLLEINTDGCEEVMKKCPYAISIFLVPPSLEDLEKRIRGRKTESEEAIEARLAKAKVELKLADEYEHVVVDNTVEQTAAEITSIIKNAMGD